MRIHTTGGFTLRILMALICFGGCAASSLPASEIEVEGEVWTRGAAPFTALVLTTEQQNHYVLVFDGEVSAPADTPARVWVRGTVYVDRWNGGPFAHLRVREIERRDE